MKIKNVVQTVNDTKEQSACENTRGIPTPVWPRTKEGSAPVQRVTGLERRKKSGDTDFSLGYKNMFGGIHYWPKFNKGFECVNPEIHEYKKPGDIIKESVDTNSDSYDSIVTDSLLLMTSTPNQNIKEKSTSEKDSSTQTRHREDMEKVIKQLTEALSRSRRVSSLKKAITRSHHKHKRKFVSDSIRNRTYVNLNWRSGYKNTNKSKPNHQAEDMVTQGHEKSSVSSMHSSSTLQLSVDNLHTGYEKPNYTESELKRNIHSNLLLSSTSGCFGPSSWTMRRQDSWGDRTELECPDCSYSRLGDSFDNFYHRRGTINIPGKRKEKLRLFVIFCKSFCFLILIVCFLIVIVIVIVFLSKGMQTPE